MSDRGAPPGDTCSEPLWDNAFGARPGQHPLAPADSPERRWWRAVALGGQGRHAAARAELDLLERPDVDPALRSLAHSTRGSLLRQLGGHVAARAQDGAALALAAASRGPDTEQARADALLGLAADALGPGRVALARRLLDEVADGGRTGGTRTAVRWCWVAAETELWSGGPDAALVHARRAVALASETGSVRHQVKSDLVLAAALGRRGGAELAAAVQDRAAAHGLLPLEWASALLQDALVDDGRPGALREASARTHHLIAHRGGVLPGVSPPWPTRGSSRTGPAGR